MLRWGVRFVAVMLLAAAFAALIVDGARTLADSTLTVTSLGATLQALFPARLVHLRALVEHAGPLAWRAMAALLAAPTWLAAAALGALLMRLTRPTRPPIGVDLR